jgi:hypothetical protein
MREDQMKSEDQVLAALKDLAAHDREREAHENIEARVRAAFRRERKMQRMRRGTIWSLAAAAVVAVIFLALPRERPAPTMVAKPAPPPEILAAVEPPAPEVHPVRRAAARKPPPREIATEFFPLMDVALPFERGQLLRVVVPASTMRPVGLPVNEDRLSERVQADVLVGEEGLARAIRFVRYEQ